MQTFTLYALQQINPWLTGMFTLIKLHRLGSYNIIILNYTLSGIAKVDL
jgi:hypothetical protein